MCGIVAGIAQRDVVPILLEGLKRLEYRGYDSAGLAVITPEEDIYRCRALGKVSELEKALLEEIEGKPKLSGTIGIAHTRWATHGAPAERNAHPHVSKDKIAVVHNGIIENYQVLKQQQIKRGYHFTSETDTEVIAHQIHWHLESVSDTEQAIKLTLADLRGAYALAVLNEDDPDRLFVVRKGSPVVIGVGIGEHFVASDVSALLPVTNQFIFLEEGDFAAIEKDSLSITNAKGLRVERSLKESDLSVHDIDRGTYRHFMLKEIFEQPVAVAATLEGRIHNEQVMDTAFGHGAGEIFDSIDGVLILACGTSYHAGMVARYWFESLAGIPCSIEVASEFRYRKSVVKSNTLVLVISQSGETADTIAALSKAKEMGCCYFLAICNVPESRLVRESDLALMTRAGPEIGVASTKAFTTQLVALLMLVIALGRRHGMSEIEEKGLVAELISLPSQIEKALELSEEIKQVAESFSEKHHALFLGRGELYPIAMEGALKLKEISYIHAEAYPAGELKHGPLALVDDEMPVIAVAPNDELLEKLNSNIQEVRARGGKLFVFTGAGSIIEECEDVNVTEVAVSGHSIAPIILTIPLQLLAYYVALIKGTDIDQPRNLAKSVTVE